MDPVSFPVLPALLNFAPSTRTVPFVAERGSEAAREFEAVFMGAVVEDMLKTGQPETFGGGHAEEIWRSFLARAFADQIVQGGGIGVASGIEESLAAARRSYGER